MNSEKGSTEILETPLIINSNLLFTEKILKFQFTNFKSNY